MSVPPMRIAHRGMPRRLPENTLPSFAKALDCGAQGIELDVHATVDGLVVVHHDAWTAGGQEIARTTWQALGRDAASQSDIPTLASVCELVNGRAELFVEIKGAGIEKAVLGALDSYPGPVAIHSFDHPTIARIARLDPTVRLGLLFEEHVPDVAALLSSCGARDAWPHHSRADARLTDSVHAAGGRVIVWTVNDRREVQRVAALGVDGICTDDVTLLDER